MPIGKTFRCTTRYGATCDSSPINVYCRNTYELRADIQARIDVGQFYAPLCIIDPITSLNIEECHKIYPNEAIVALVNNLPKEGTYNCALYYGNIYKTSLDFYGYAGGALFLYVAYHSEEIYYNGTYSFKFTHSNGTVVLNENFEVTGGVDIPKETPELAIVDNLMEIIEPSNYACDFFKGTCDLHIGDKIAWSCYVTGGVGKRHIYLIFWQNSWGRVVSLGSFPGNQCSGYYTVPSGKFSIGTSGHLQLRVRDEDTSKLFGYEEKHGRYFPVHYVAALPEICIWISAKGGPTMLTVPDIFELIDSYLFNTPPVGYSFVPTILQLFGVVDYYLGFNGDVKTGCDYNAKV